MLTAIKYRKSQNILLILCKCNGGAFYTKRAEVHMHHCFYYQDVT
jgi:hypothetical protein